VRMDGPLGFLRTAEVGTLLTVTAAATVVCARFFPPLATRTASKGIVSLELAWTQNRVAEVTDSWRVERLERAAQRSVSLDFLFIALYAATIALLGVMAGRAATASGLLSSEHADTVGTALAIAPLAAGLCDCVENVGLLALLSGHLQQPIPAVTSAVSLSKWILVAASLMGSLGILILSCGAAW
jgi:hypothetical protein